VGSVLAARAGAPVGRNLDGGHAHGLLSLSFVLLLVAFRSIVIPAKAILMNLLSAMVPIFSRPRARSSR
jgi:hypothetical protein